MKTIMYGQENVSPKSLVCGVVDISPPVVASADPFARTFGNLQAPMGHLANPFAMVDNAPHRAEPKPPRDSMLVGPPVMPPSDELADVLAQNTSTMVDD